MTTGPATEQVTPLGRDEVAAAVLESAAQLFAERGPAATSIRDVAARSKVNHGLVFRHFGTKDQLVGAVLDHLAGRLTEVVASGASAAEVDAAIDRHTRVIARALLDGYPAGQLQKAFPNMDLLLERVRIRHDDDAQARLATANIVALQLGWTLFRPFLNTALGLDEFAPEDVRRSTDAAIATLLDLRPVDTEPNDLRD
jgi:TetR/AcrR family transcriptional regulator, repressor for neighboring sulfatase